MPSADRTHQCDSVEPRIVVALDFASAGRALELVDRLDPGRCRLKVGKELFVRTGPELVKRLVDRGYSVFLDLKFHDIPNTVAGACRAAADLGVWMVNVHALGGKEMLTAARRAIDSDSQRPLLIGVTLLTSHDIQSLGEIGLQGDPLTGVTRLAELAQHTGLDGVVCSAQEASGLRARFAKDFRLVVPGIRAFGARTDDQRRVVTPAAAIAAGADYLVVGRPITRAADPLWALSALEQEMRSARRRLDR
ncbi:orotidine-5'-phosphate decarboxylase [Nitrococcus mobilis]|uniref:Orotidine 5'-phosphate decarboxylase n=1 Tax=Nitrococcus mobilis Nb-231 TaxID=314278 RepID=A4BM58_9GAMM|nr:orotidine-5'-phosphate decarboxylase [Nitrococcus mobilis]EAR23396.1 orotidine 5'-phosphate decarboxylase [Nitrococcus mobilis Nb-231]